MYYRKNIFLLIIFIIITTLLTGCLGRGRNIAPAKIPDQAKMNIEKSPASGKTTPELLGGPELNNRTTEHNPVFKGKVFFDASTNKKIAALTFDDGPDDNFTPRILDILKQNNIHATFFIVGERALSNPDMVKRIYDGGHVVGNHTWDHPQISKLSTDKVSSELTHTSNLLFSLTGMYPVLFRPPYGAASPDIIKQITSMGYKIIDWSVDTRDWAGTPPPQIMNFVRKELKPGGIVLEHCAGGRTEDLNNTVKALPEIISTYRAQGYTFVTVPELLNISAYKNR